jgi:hypothetical protein
LTRARLAAFLLLFTARAAFAALADEIQVYTDDLEAKGERGVELHVNSTPSGRSIPAYPGEVTAHHGLRVTPEISWGLGNGMDWGVYLPFVRGADGAAWFAGPKFRLKWLPLRPPEGGTGAFAGLNGEIAFTQGRFEEARRSVEVRPILGWRGEAWLFAFNPNIEFDLAGAQKGVLTFAPALKVARTVADRTQLGIEYYGDWGRVASFAPRAEQAHTLYFVVDAERAFGVNFGIGRGFSGAADRWTVKSIVSF